MAGRLHFAGFPGVTVMNAFQPVQPYSSVAAAAFLMAF